jgi:hypothetical protein
MRRPSLPRIVISVPCPADWRSMEPIAGDSRARLCRRCDKPVYDSKSMTRDELYALIAKTEGAPPCLQLHQRPDGTIVTKGCLSAIYRTGRFLWLKVAACAIAFWAAVAGLRRAVDGATAPRPRSLEIRSEPSETITLGLGTFIRPPTPARVSAARPKPESERELRHLLSEEDLLPPAWRD